MSLHPADCACSQADPRIITCPVCGTSRPETHQACPCCAQTRDQYRAALATIAALRAEIRRLTGAFVELHGRVLR